jgi:hypothetical protein
MARHAKPRTSSITIRPTATRTKERALSGVHRLTVLDDGDGLHPPSKVLLQAEKTQRNVHCKFRNCACVERVWLKFVGVVCSGALDGEAGSGEAARAAVVGEAPLLHISTAPDAYGRGATKNLLCCCGGVSSVCCGSPANGSLVFIAARAGRRSCRASRAAVPRWRKRIPGWIWVGPWRFSRGRVAVCERAIWLLVRVVTLLDQSPSVDQSARGRGERGGKNLFGSPMAAPGRGTPYRDSAMPDQDERGDYSRTTCIALTRSRALSGYRVKVLLSTKFYPPGPTKDSTPSIAQS